MKKKVICLAILIILIPILLPSTVYANSSWHWLTISPRWLLPFAISLTLLIETLAVIKPGKVTKPKKALLIISLANLLSFVAPYLERAYRFIPTSGGFSVFAAFEKGPYYMILFGYLVLTLCVELPVVYLLLRRDTSDQKSLGKAIVLANTATTLLVAVLERLICRGTW